MLKSQGLLESEDGSSIASSGGHRGQRLERLSERKKLHKLKRDHEQQESSKRKVLRLEEAQEKSSESDSEDRGRKKKENDKAAIDLDIQVKVINSQQCLYK